MTLKKKRYRAPVPKEGELLVKFGRGDAGDTDLQLQYCYPDNECGMSADSSLMLVAFQVNRLTDRTLVEELELRGYDIETLTFSIKKKL